MDGGCVTCDQKVHMELINRDYINGVNRREAEEGSSRKRAKRDY